MTDLKAANEALAKALAALESPEHDADVREAEAIRNRLIELDGRIGARIEAKLDAHKAIAEAWGAPTEAPKPFGYIEDPKQAVDVNTDGYSALLKDIGRERTAVSLADAWQAHHEEHTGKYAMTGDEIPERVLANGVAEMQQAVHADEQ